MNMNNHEAYEFFTNALNDLEKRSDRTAKEERWDTNFRAQTYRSIHHLRYLLELAKDSPAFGNPPPGTLDSGRKMGVLERGLNAIGIVESEE